jgi:hypothetical protein
LKTCFNLNVIEFSIGEILHLFSVLKTSKERNHKSEYKMGESKRAKTKRAKVVMGENKKGA